MQSFSKQKKKKGVKERAGKTEYHAQQRKRHLLSCMKLHNNYRRYQALQEHHIFGGVRIGHIQDITG